MKPEVKFMPDNKSIRVKPGTTVLEASRKARVHIRTRCGGNASCLMCKVIVPDPSGLEEMAPNERRKLGELADRAYRLACQARIRSDVEVMLPEDPLKAAVRAKLAKQREEDDAW